MRRLTMLGNICLVGMMGLGTAAFAASTATVVTHLKTSAGQDAGTATFKQGKNGKVTVKLELKNLPFGQHAVHIHQNPVCEAPDFKTAGGHFNPEHKQHGTMNPMGHHDGDLPGDISIGEDHMGSATFKLDYISVGTGAANDILANGGTSIMVHNNPDDMKTDPTGNAGNRIACGVITAAK